MRKIFSWLMVLLQQLRFNPSSNLELCESDRYQKRIQRKAQVSIRLLTWNYAKGQDLSLDEIEKRSFNPSSNLELCERVIDLYHMD